jgi:exodeoxyribonuclease V beta subunit
LYADGSNRRPLTLVRLPDEINGSQARVTFARFIANEIQHLLTNGIEIVEWRDGTPYRRPLHPGDICILIRSRGELPAIDRALRWANIPYSFPKQGGLFSTLEALEWRYLLRAIALPDDPRAVMTVLLTRFFGCAPETLESYPSLPSTHPIKLTIARWHTLAERRAWAPLFQAIFAETGMLARELHGDDGERIVTNHQHLAQLALHPESNRQVKGCRQQRA